MEAGPVTAHSWVHGAGKCAAKPNVPALDLELHAHVVPIGLGCGPVQRTRQSMLHLAPRCMYTTISLRHRPRESWQHRTPAQLHDRAAFAFQSDVTPLPPGQNCAAHLDSCKQVIGPSTSNAINHCGPLFASRMRTRSHLQRGRAPVDQLARPPDRPKANATGTAAGTANMRFAYC
jgi:hypothetical protein